MQTQNLYQVSDNLQVFERLTPRMRLAEELYREVHPLFNHKVSTPGQMAKVLHLPVLGSFYIVSRDEKFQRYARVMDQVQRQSVACTDTMCKKHISEKCVMHRNRVPPGDHPSADPIEVRSALEGLVHQMPSYVSFCLTSDAGGQQVKLCNACIRIFRSYKCPIVWWPSAVWDPKSDFELKCCLVGCRSCVPEGTYQVNLMVRKSIVRSVGRICVVRTYDLPLVLHQALTLFGFPDTSKLMVSGDPNFEFDGTYSIKQKVVACAMIDKDLEMEINHIVRDEEGKPVRQIWLKQVPSLTYFCIHALVQCDSNWSQGPFGQLLPKWKRIGAKGLDLDQLPPELLVPIRDLLCFQDDRFDLMGKRFWVWMQELKNPDLSRLLIDMARQQMWVFRNLFRFKYYHLPESQVLSTVYERPFM
jgi:hypothetical protein